MKYKKFTEFLTVTLLFSFGISQTYTVQASSSNDTKVAKKYKYDYTDQKKAKNLKKKNKKIEKKISSLDKKIADLQKQLKNYTNPNAVESLSKREPLHVNPTGWHNKKINDHWLYNRSHLIGYQLTGQNNNWKNLMTGTRHLNDPDMLMYENEVATYLKSSPSNYVRYRVTPIFRNNELLARGVEMEGQSINSNDVHFHVYIFNVQDGVNINYANGTSKAS